MAVIGSLSVAITANTAKFAKGIGNATKRLNVFSRAAKGAGGSLTGQLGPFVAAAAGAFTLGKGISAVISSFQSLDAMAKHADKIGITTEALGQLRFVAEQTGVSSNVLDSALQKMSKRVAKAGVGGGPAVKVLGELGLSAKALAAESPDVQLRAIGQAMAGVKNQSDKIRIADTIFGKEGVGLLNTFQSDIEGLSTQFDDLGGSVSRVDAGKIEAANDSMDRFKVALGGIVTKVTVAVAPTVDKLATWLAERVPSAFDTLLKTAKFVFTNFPTIMELGINKGILAVGTFILDMKHAFTVKLPAFFKGAAAGIGKFFENWKKMAVKFAKAYSKVLINPFSKKNRQALGGFATGIGAGVGDAFRSGKGDDTKRDKSFYESIQEDFIKGLEDKIAKSGASIFNDPKSPPKVKLDPVDYAKFAGDDSKKAKTIKASKIVATKIDVDKINEKNQGVTRGSSESIALQIAQHGGFGGKGLRKGGKGKTPVRNPVDEGLFGAEFEAKRGLSRADPRNAPVNAPFSARNAPVRAPSPSSSQTRELTELETISGSLTTLVAMATKNNTNGNGQSLLGGIV